MTQHTAKRRRSGCVSHDFHTSGIASRIDRHRAAFNGVEDRRQRGVLVQRLPASAVHVAHGGPDLFIRIRPEIFHQEIHEPPVPLQDREDLRGAVVALDPGLDPRLDWCRCSGNPHRCSRRRRERGQDVVGDAPVEDQGEKGTKGVLPAFAVRKHSWDCTVSRSVVRGPPSAKDGTNQR